MLGGIDTRFSLLLIHRSILLVRYTLLSKEPQVSMSIVSPNQPQHHETVLETFQQLKVQPTYF